MGSLIGTLKKHARRIGISLEEYQSLVNSGQKWCYKCKQWKNKTNYSQDKSRWDALKAICKNCDYPKKDNSPSKPERIEKAKTGFAWCRGCKEWIQKVTNSKWQGACTSCLAREQKKIYHENEETRFKIVQRVRDRRKKIDPISLHLKNELMNISKGLCVYCCKSQATGLDHVIPVVKGGKSKKGNLVPCCRHCNSSKNQSNLNEWLAKNNIIPHEVFWILFTEEETNE